MLELPKREIIINFLKFHLNFIILNIYHNYFFKFNLNFLILKP
jgi:hypothetical protein